MFFSYVQKIMALYRHLTCVHMRTPKTPNRVFIFRFEWKSLKLYKIQLLYVFFVCRKFEVCSFNYKVSLKSLKNPQTQFIDFLPP